MSAKPIRDLEIGDYVNWRTVNSRGNPVSRLCSVYFRPYKDGIVTVYCYGESKLRRLPMAELRLKRSQATK